jgi:hypothetical protein
MPSFVQGTQAVQPTVQATTFLPADTTVAKSILAAQIGPWHLFEITITSDDTAAQVVDFFLHIGATNTLIGSAAVPAGSGKAGVAPVSWLHDALTATLTGLDFHGQASLQAGMEATVTTAKTVTVTVWFADY